MGEVKDSYIRDVKGGANIPAKVLWVYSKVTEARRKLVDGPLSFAVLGEGAAYFINGSFVYLSGQITYVWHPATQISSFEIPCVEVNFSREFLDQCALKPPVSAVSEGSVYDMDLPGWMQPGSVQIYRLAAMLLAQEKWPELDEDDDWTLLACDQAALGSENFWDYGRFFLAGHPGRAERIQRAVSGLERQPETPQSRFRFSGLCLDAVAALQSLGNVTTITREKSIEFRSDEFGSVYVPLTAHDTPND